MNKEFLKIRSKWNKEFKQNPQKFPIPKWEEPLFYPFFPKIR